MENDIPLMINTLLVILFRVIEVGGIVAAFVLIFKINKKLNRLLNLLDKNDD